MSENNETNELPRFLNDVQCKKLIIALAAARGEKGFTESEAGKLIKWAELVSFQYTSLHLALKGHVLIDMQDDDPNNLDNILFKAAKNSLSPGSLETLQQILSDPRLEDDDLDDTETVGDDEYMIDESAPYYTQRP